MATLVFDCGQLAEALRSGDLKLEGDRTAVARFLSLFALPEPAAADAGGPLELSTGELPRMRLLLGTSVNKGLLVCLLTLRDRTGGNRKERVAYTPSMQESASLKWRFFVAVLANGPLSRDQS